MYDYHGVRSWCKKGRFLLNDLDLILAPIHVKRAHWVLAGINVRERHVLYYDSFGEDYETIVPMLRRWLHDEAVERLGASAADLWGVAAWPLIMDCGRPVQMDTGSCGVFALAAAECL